MLDLHMHTTHSDGLQSVSDILKKAEDLKLDYISITDHDSVDSYEELKNENVRNLFSGKIIRGTELYFLHESGIYNEFLGYDIDTEKISKSPIFNKDIRREFEKKNLLKGYDLFSKAGFTLSPIPVLEKIISKSNNFGIEILRRDLMSKTKNADLMEKFGIHSAKDYYLKHIDDTNSQFYFHTFKHKPSMEFVSKTIRDAGGLVFMAHIFRKPKNEALFLLDHAVKNNLIDGIEVYYKTHTKEEIEFLEEFCKNHKLYMSGGADSHCIPEGLGFINNGTRPIELVKEMDWLKKCEEV